MILADLILLQIKYINIMEKLYDESPYEFIPQAGKCYNTGWKVMTTVFIELLVVTLVVSVIQAPLSVFWSEDNHFHWFLVPFVLFAFGYGLFVVGPIKYSVNWVFLKAVRSEKIEIKDMFAVFQKNYWNAVIAGVVVMTIVGIGMVMLIVPGIIFAVRLAFVPYLIMDREMEVMDALRGSWEMTKGYGWRIFGMGLLAVPIVILGLICLGVGVIISAMWITTAFAVMYHTVTLKDGVPSDNTV